MRSPRTAVPRSPRTVALRLLASLAPLTLAAATLCPVTLAAAIRPAIAVHQVASTPLLRRSRHTIVRGYLTDRQPWSDSTLDVYSKAHRTTYHVEMTRSTVVKLHGQVVPRAALRSGQYVFATCDRSGSTLVAIRVTIVVRHSHRRKH